VPLIRRDSRRRMCGVLVTGALAFAGTTAGRAETLADALAGAGGRDPAVIGARAQADATRERIGVIRAAGAPTLGVGGTANTQYAEVNGGSARQIEGGSGAINLNVPLYRPQVGAALEQAGVASRSAGVQVDAAEQDLLLRTSVAYLEVLAAIETQQTIGAQKSALVKQLASARRSFEVGTATILDPNEAQARLDLVLAQEINARADLSVRRAALAQIVGRGFERYRRLAPDTALPVLPYPILESWLEIAAEESPAVRRARLELEIAEREIERRALGDRPSVDGVGTVSREVNPSPVFGQLRTNLALLGLQVNWRAYDGGAVSAGVREAVSLAGKTAADLEAARRQADLEVRRLFAKVSSGYAVVAALRAAERSAEVTLRSMTRAQEVGVRVLTDVLNAQQQLFVARRDFARARYDFLADTLRLRAAAGRLRADDVTAISALLSEPVEVIDSPGR
jgi:outer membrane protein